MTMPVPGIDARYGMRVRTPELPMAFTFGEFARGAGVAWLAFQLVFPLTLPVASIVTAFTTPDPLDAVVDGISWALFAVLMTFLYALPWSIGALLFVGGPAAWLLGLALRRVSSSTVHLLAFAALGLAVGALTMWIPIWLTPEGAGSQVSPGFALAGAAVTGASVAYGWRFTAMRALADDALFREHAAGPSVE